MVVHSLQLFFATLTDFFSVFSLQMTGRYAEYAEELAKVVQHDFKPKIVKE